MIPILHVQMDDTYQDISRYSDTPLKFEGSGVWALQMVCSTEHEHQVYILTELITGGELHGHWDAAFELECHAMQCHVLYCILYS